MVQHRPALGLWHRRPRPGPLLRRSPDRRADASRPRLRASAAACLLHPVGRRTTSSTKAASWTCGCARRACSNTARAPAPTSRCLRGENEKLSGGGKSSGLMSLPQDRRSRRRRHQVGRHHAPRRQDGVVDVDHPDIEAFIDWKVKEEQKVAALVTGSKMRQST
jgi:hypothetical protein